MDHVSLNRQRCEEKKKKKKQEDRSEMSWKRKKKKQKKNANEITDDRYLTILSNKKEKTERK